MPPDKRNPNSEPTLMIGDVPMNFDFSHIDNLICNTYPTPIQLRKSPTRNETSINAFYQYSSFVDARNALRILNGAVVPGMENHYQLDMNFTKQRVEACAHITISFVHFNRFEVMKLFSRYSSVLGLSQYNFKLWNGSVPRTTSFIRFRDQDECMQAVQELNNIPVEDSVIHMTISTRFIDSLKEYVIKREAEKMEVGVPEFHNFYEKKRVNVEQFNEIVMASSSEYFDDLEASRWSSIAFKTNAIDIHYNRQITIDYFEN